MAWVDDLYYVNLLTAIFMQCLSSPMIVILLDPSLENHMDTHLRVYGPNMSRH